MTSSPQVRAIFEMTDEKTPYDELITLRKVWGSRAALRLAGSLFPAHSEPRVTGSRDQCLKRAGPPLRASAGAPARSTGRLAAGKPACRHGTRLRVCLGILQSVSGASACARTDLTHTWRPRYGNPVRNPGLPAAADFAPP